MDRRSALAAAAVVALAAAAASGRPAVAKPAEAPRPSPSRPSVVETDDGAGLFYTPRSESSFDALIAGLKQDRPAFFAKSVAAFTGGHPAVSPAMTEWVIAQFMRASPKAAIDCMRAITRGDSRA